MSLKRNDEKLSSLLNNLPSKIRKKKYKCNEALINLLSMMIKNACKFHNPSVQHNVHSSNSHFCLDSVLGIYSIIVTASRFRDMLTSNLQLTNQTKIDDT